MIYRKKLLALFALILLMSACFAGCSLFGGDSGDGPENRYYVSTGEYYVTNVKDSDMLIKVSMEVLLSKDDSELVTQNMSGIRNIIIQTLREKTEQEVLSVDAIVNLEAELTEKVGELLEMDEFKQIVISDYVVQ